MDATRYFPFAGRLLIALTFVMSGLSKVADYSGTLGLISATKLPLPAPLETYPVDSGFPRCSVLSDRIWRGREDGYRWRERGRSRNSRNRFPTR
jgi:DoxX